ncbi:MAG: surface-binding protein [Desulfovibrio sp.]|nr:surface-binding protein [Desulfovibrio sp.]
MADFATAYAPLAQYEGGYSNNAADRGGETYAGIARNFFPSWAGWRVIDKWKNTVGTKPSVLNKALSTVAELRPLVEDWYRVEWWEKLGLGSLSQKVADEIFEQTVNLGKGGAAKKVQIVCNAYNFKSGRPLFPDLKVDGAIGPKTLSALRTIIASHKADEAALVHALNCMQGAHYLELAAKKPSQRVFTSGWMKRTHCE